MDAPEFRGYVNQLVGWALGSLKDTDRVSIDDKREVARLAREAIKTGVSKGEQTIKEGQVGPLRYQVGVYAFESYWETNYGGKREIHARHSGLAPFVALKVIEARDRDKQP